MVQAGGAKTINYSDGSQYVGTVLESGERDKGKITWSNGMTFNGYFRKDKP